MYFRFVKFLIRDKNNAESPLFFLVNRINRSRTSHVIDKKKNPTKMQQQQPMKINHAPGLDPVINPSYSFQPAHIEDYVTSLPEQAQTSPYHQLWPSAHPKWAAVVANAPSHNVMGPAVNPEIIREQSYWYSNTDTAERYVPQSLQRLASGLPVDKLSDQWLSDIVSVSDPTRPWKSRSTPSYVASPFDNRNSIKRRENSRVVGLAPRNYRTAQGETCPYRPLVVIDETKQTKVVCPLLYPGNAPPQCLARLEQIFDCDRFLRGHTKNWSLYHQCQQRKRLLHFNVTLPQGHIIPLAVEMDGEGPIVAQIALAYCASSCAAPVFRPLKIPWQQRATAYPEVPFTNAIYHS